MSLSIPNTFTSGTVVDASDVNENFTAVSQKFGNIDNSDVKSGAGISIDKLSASYEYLPISVTLASGAAASDVLVPVYNDGKGDWTAVAAQWATLDTGAPSAVVKIDWGVLDGTADDTMANQFSSTTTVATITISGGANISTQGIQTTVTSPAFGGGGVYRSLRFYVSTVDATATDPIYVTLLLKRQIAT